MSPKPLAPLAKRLMKGVIALELLGVLGAYALFHRMNSSQGDLSLHFYYQSNEWAGIYGIRERDREVWASRRD
uniref:CEBPZ opposite strand n=1 Tax=Salarias fasciatus TaxID=181472 RepID=A0A672FFD8_SALFA